MTTKATTPPTTPPAIAPTLGFDPLELDGSDRVAERVGAVYGFLK